MSSLIATDGRNLDAIFDKAVPAGWNVGTVADDGVDVGRRFTFRDLGVAPGTTTNFLTADGWDFGSYFAGAGTSGMTMNGGYYLEDQLIPGEWDAEFSGFAKISDMLSHPSLGYYNGPGNDIGTLHPNPLSSAHPKLSFLVLGNEWEGGTANLPDGVYMACLNTAYIGRGATVTMSGFRTFNMGIGQDYRTHPTQPPGGTWWQCFLTAADYRAAKSWFVGQRTVTLTFW